MKKISPLWSWSVKALSVKAMVLLLGTQLQLVQATTERSSTELSELEMGTSKRVTIVHLLDFKDQAARNKFARAMDAEKALYQKMGARVKFVGEGAELMIGDHHWEAVVMESFPTLAAYQDYLKQDKARTVVSKKEAVANSLVIIGKDRAAPRDEEYDHNYDELLSLKDKEYQQKGLRLNKLEMLKLVYHSISAAQEPVYLLNLLQFKDTIQDPELLSAVERGDHCQTGLGLYEKYMAFASTFLRKQGASVEEWLSTGSKDTNKNREGVLLVKYNTRKGILDANSDKMYSYIAGLRKHALKVDADTKDEKSVLLATRKLETLEVYPTTIMGKLFGY